MEVQRNDEKPASEWRPPRVGEQRKDKDNAIPEVNAWIPEVDLGGFTDAQKVIAKQMLMDESDCFAQNDEDIGCADKLKMKK